MQKIRFTIILLALAVSTTGCTVLKSRQPKPIVPCETPKCNNKPVKETAESCIGSVESQILATARSIEKSLGVLAAAEKAENPPILTTGPLITPEGGMGGLADVDWTGPVGPLVERIAALTNYRVKSLGNEPAIPVIVTINAKRTVIADILQNASLQSGRRAEILVFPGTRTIEVRYLST